MKIVPMTSGDIIVPFANEPFDSSVEEKRRNEILRKRLSALK